MASQRICEGRVALVTGASQGGTGTAIALRLAAEGARVAVTARSPGGLDETVRRLAPLRPDRHPRQQRGDGRLQAVRGLDRARAGDDDPCQRVVAVGADARSRT